MIKFLRRGHYLRTALSSIGPSFCPYILNPRPARLPACLLEAVWCRPAVCLILLPLTGLQIFYFF